MSVVIACFGNPHECPNCGGSVHAWSDSLIVAGRVVPAKGATRGPFAAMDGSNYCTSDCAEEAAEFRTRALRWTESTWCSSCGYDNHEHGPGCPAS